MFDPDWNPQNDFQALRCNHRIEQTKKVDVIRLITHGTYEHDMFLRSQRKLRLWMTLLGDGNVTDPATAEKCILRQEGRDMQVRKKFVAPFGVDGFRAPGADIPRHEGVEIPPQSNTIYSSQSFEGVLHRSVDVIKDLPEMEFPDLDLTDDILDEEFLNRFPIDPAQIASVDVHRARAMQQPRVKIAPKMAKRILICLQRYGYVAGKRFPGRSPASVRSNNSSNSRRLRSSSISGRSIPLRSPSSRCCSSSSKQTSPISTLPRSAARTSPTGTQSIGKKLPAAKFPITFTKPPSRSYRASTPACSSRGGGASSRPPPSHTTCCR
jgi:hypothetical protein